MDVEGDDAGALNRFVAGLGATMADVGEPVSVIQDRLRAVAAAYGADAATVTAFPTYVMVSLDHGRPAAIQVTAPLGGAVRLDRLASLDRLLADAERRAVTPTEGLRRLDDLRTMRPRFGALVGVVGYAVLTAGLCLILQPAAGEVLAAAALGAAVGSLRIAGERSGPLAALMPVLAACTVSALTALAVRHGIADPGLRPIVASLVVFLPGAALTTAVVELAAGQMISGASRLVSGGVQLALLAFGILVGIDAVGAPAPSVLAGSAARLGAWAPWLGVLVFAVGVTVSHSAPRRSFPGLLLVLYAAWTGQVLGSAVLGGYLGALTGAVVLTVVARLVTRLPWAMPERASFLPGFWLLVPGTLGLIGVAEVASETTPVGSGDLAATGGTILAVALGVLSGTYVVAVPPLDRRRVRRA